MLPTLLNTTPSNHILGAMPRHDLERLAADLRLVKLNKGQVLHEEGRSMQHVYFLEKGMVSLILSDFDGASVEVGMVGTEGVVGTYCVSGSDQAYSQAMVQLESRAWRMPLSLFQAEFRRGGVLHRLALQHLELLHLQASQTALCNRLHSVDERLCRWLLLAKDCSQVEYLTFTQEQISQMLGVRRSGVTIAARALQDAHLIQYSRGCIEVLDHAGLEARVCSCYSAVHRRFEHLIARCRTEQERAGHLISRASDAQRTTADAVIQSARLRDASLARRQQAADNRQPTTDNRIPVANTVPPVIVEVVAKPRVRQPVR